MSARRPYCPWTHRDWETVQKMARAGRSNRQIAEAVGRSYWAVAVRARMFRPRWAGAAKAPPPAILIFRADVPTYYALGWRFASFEGALCLFEWPHADAPYFPEMMREAA